MLAPGIEYFRNCWRDMIGGLLRMPWHFFHDVTDEPK
jgi:hypothetical protein